MFDRWRSGRHPLSASGMRLKDLDLGDTIGQNNFYRKSITKLRGDAKKTKGVLLEINLALMLGCPGKLHDNMNKSLQDTIDQEVKQLAALSHANIAQMLNAFQERDCLYFIVEYFEEGSLQRLIQMRSGKMVPEPILEPQVIEWLTQITRGLQFYHFREYFHGNVNAKNIFFSANMKTVKIGECAIGRILEKTTQIGKCAYGSPHYRAPEVWEGKAYTRKADIWSTGVLLYQLLSLKLPFEGSSDIELYSRIKAGTKPQIPFAYSNETALLVERLMATEPSSRPWINEVVADLEGAMIARPFQTVYWWNLKPPKKPSASFQANGDGAPPKKPWFSSPSEIVELLTYREANVILVFCKGGEIIALENKFDTPEAIVRWRGHVTVPRTVANGETKLAHAGVYPSHGLAFFTITPPTEGIFTADLKQIAKSKSTPVEMKRFDRGYSTIAESDRMFNGLTIDIENQAILCCDQTRKKTIGVWSVVDGRIHGEITVPNAGDGQFRPYKACLYQTFINDKRCQLLGVCDAPNSNIHLFLLNKGAGNILVEPRFLRTLAPMGSIVGSVYQPQGVIFDPSGHLLVADAGNHRIQIFSADLPDTPVKGVLWDSFTTSTSGQFDEPVSLVAALDPKTSKPVILAGLKKNQEILMFQ